MSDSTLTLTEANYAVLLKAHNETKGKLEGHATVAALALVNETTPAVVLSTFNKLRAERAKGDGLKALQTLGESVVLKGNKLLSLGAEGNKFLSKFEGAKLTYSLVFATDDKGKVTQATVKVTAGTQRATKGGEVSSTSRKSAFKAWEETKGADKTPEGKVIKFERVKDSAGKLTGYYDMTDGAGKRFVKRGKLNGYIGKVYPLSLTAATLKRYGQLD